MNDPTLHSKFEQLRRQAEQLLRGGEDERSERFSQMGILSLIDELEVQQAELQIQNEEPQSAKIELEQSRDRYAELYERAPVGYVDLDGHGFITRSNNAAKKMLGIPSCRSNHPFAALIHPEHQGRLSSIMGDSAVKGGKTIGTCEIRTARKNKTGPPGFIQMEVAAALGPRRSFEGWHVAFVDITRRKQMEEELREARDRLEAEVRKRTAALSKANETLRAEAKERKQLQAERDIYLKKLERSNLELQDFAFIASHDLQEPLRKIRGFAEMLRNKFAPALGPEGSDLVERMSRAAGRLQKMVNGLLSYSRVAVAGAGFAPAELGGVVRGVISDLQWQIEKAKAVVEVGELRPSRPMRTRCASFSRMLSPIRSNSGANSDALQKSTASRLKHRRTSPKILADLCRGQRHRL
jgi:PAS domain S-box-containing protein